LKNIISIVAKCVAVPFYKEHAILFMALFYFCFGIMRPMDHIAILNIVLQSWSYVSGCFLLWTIYNIRVTFFFAAQLIKPQHTFLLHLYLLPRTHKFLALAIIQIILLAPVIGYAFFMLKIGVDLHQWQILSGIISFLMVSIVVPVIYLKHKLRFPDTGYKYLSITSFITQRISKPALTFFFFDLLHNRLVILLLTKFFSAVLLIGFVTIFNVGTPDLRPLLIAMMAVALAHGTLINQYHVFENQELLYFKNLPIPPYRYFIKAILSIGILLIPECILLIRYLPVQYDFIGVIVPFVFAISLLTMAWSLIYKEQDEEKLLKIVTYAGFAYFFVIMFSLPALLLIAFNFGLAFWWHRKYYYQFQVQVKK
jgi:hypothetical protein